MRSNQRWAALAGAPLVVFLALPILATAIRGLSPLKTAIASPEAGQAIVVSLKTTFASLAVLILFGTPLGVYLARANRIAAITIEAIVDLPLVLPPAAAGIALLLAFGRHGILPTAIAFTPVAVVAAQTFVAAPIFVRSSTAAFRLVPRDILEMASLEGAGEFRRWTRITLPIAAPVFFSGCAMAWSRALGEFGATILFAGSLAGKTQTLPLAIYFAFQSDLDQAIGLALLLLLIAGAVLALARVAASKQHS